LTGGGSIGQHRLMAGPAQPTAEGPRGGNDWSAADADPWSATEIGDKPDDATPDSGAWSLAPPDGKVTLDEKAGLAARHTAYALLDDAAAQIAEQVTAGAGGDGVRVIVVEDRALLASDWQHASITGQMAAIRKQLDAARKLLASPLPPDAPAPTAAATPSAAGLAAAGAPAAIGAVAAAVNGVNGVKGVVEDVAGIVQLFRSDYQVTTTAADLTITATPLVSAVAHAMRKIGAQVRVDGLALAGGPLLRDFFALRAERDELATAYLSFNALEVSWRVDRAAERRAEIDAKVLAHDKAVADGAKGARALGRQLAEARARYETADRNAAAATAHAAVAKAAIDRFDAFETAVTTVPAGASMAPLAVAASRDVLHGDDQALEVLFVQLESAGGELITHHSLWSSSARAIVMGGVVVSWMLVNLRDSTVRRAGCIPLVASSSFSLATGQIEDPVAAAVAEERQPRGWVRRR
jgi:hypothetical protein